MIYNISNFIINPDQGFIAANIKDLIAACDKVVMVTPSTEYRPDLVSQNIYGTVELKWLLMYVNKLCGLVQFTSGLVLKYPPKTIIVEYMLRTQEEVNG